MKKQKKKNNFKTLQWVLFILMTGLSFFTQANTDLSKFVTTSSSGALIKEIMAATPVFTNSDFLNVDENTTFVEKMNATPSDGGGTITYSIVGGNDDTSFTIDPVTGDLSLLSAPNFESGSIQFHVIIRANDGAATTDGTFIVFVQDVDEFPLSFASSGSFSIFEGRTQVGDVSGSDADGSDIVYSVTGGPDQAKFSIAAAFDALFQPVGRISFLEAPTHAAPGDADGNNIYVVEVTATSGNQSLVQTVSITINAETPTYTLTVTVQNATKDYGDTNPAFNLTYTGFQGSDDESILDVAPSVTTSIDETTGVGVHTISASGGSDGLYLFSYVSGALTINKRELTIAPKDSSLVFGNNGGIATTNVGFQVTNFANGDDVTDLTFTSTASKPWSVLNGSKDVGTYPNAINYLFLGDDYPIPVAHPNYTFKYGSATLTVIKTPITVTAVVNTKVYDQDPASDPAFSYTANGLPSGASYITYPDPATLLTGSLTRVAGEPVGTYAIEQGSVASNDTNYEVTNFVSADFSITKATINVQPQASVVYKTYGDAVPGGIALTYTGFVGSDNASMIDTPPTFTASGVDATTPASSTRYALTGSGGLDDSYLFSFTDGQLEVVRRQVTMAIDDKTLEYGNPVPSSGDLTYTIDPAQFVNGDDLSTAYPSAPVVEVSSPPLPVHRPNVGTYSEVINIKHPTGFSENYFITTNPSSAPKADLIYIPKPVTIPTLSNQNYNHTGSTVSYSLPTFANTVDGGNHTLIAEYKLTSETDVAYTTTAPSANGNYNVRVSLDASETNFSATSQVTTMHIGDGTPPVITRLGSNPVLINQGDSYTDAGATASDNVDGDITASIVVTNPVNTAVSGDYIVKYNVSDAVGNTATEVTRTVNVRTPQTITFNALANNTFGAENFDLTAMASSTLDVAYISSNTSVATISSNTVTIVGVGTTTITASQAGDGTYLPASNVDQTLTIDPFNTTISLNLPGTNPTYIGVGQDITPTANDASSNPTLSLVTEYSVQSANSFSTTLPVNAGTYDVRTNLNASETNYTATQATGTFTIAKAPLTVRLNDASVVYGVSGANNHPATYTGFVNGETESVLTITIGSPTVLFLDVSNGFSYYSVGGPYTDAITWLPDASTDITSSNYAITFASGNITSITPRPINVTANNRTLTYGADANTGNTITFEVNDNPGMRGLASGESVADFTGTVTFDNIAPLNAGTHTGVITPNGGLTNANYNITYVSGDLTINKVPLQVRAQNVDVEAGSSTLPTITFEYRGFQNNDAVDGSADISGLAGVVNLNTITATAPGIDFNALGNNYDLSVDVGTATTTNYTFSVDPTQGQATIVDTTPPVITLLGDNPITITVGSSFSDPGATALDNVDGAVMVTTGGSVDATTVGNYMLTYDAVDAQGNNTVQVTRTVDVVNKPATALHFEQAVNFTDYDYLSVTDNSTLDFTTDFTYETWVNFDQLTVTNTGFGWRCLMAKSRYTDAYALMVYSGDKRMRFYHAGFGAGFTDYFWTSLSADAWHHVAVKVDGTNNKASILIDGVEMASGADAGSGILVPNNKPLLIGAGENRASDPYPFDGAMDEIRFWNYARTDAQILANKDTELTGNESGLVLYYNFDEGTIDGDNTGLTQVTDRSGAGNHATFNRFALSGVVSNYVDGTGNGVLPGLLQTVNFSALANKTVGDPDFNLTATASSGLPVTFSSSNTTIATISGNTVTIVGGGTVNIIASQTGGAGYSAAPDIAQSMIVNPTDQTITFGSLSNQGFGDSDLVLTGSSSSGLSVSYTSSDPSVATVSGNTVTTVGLGTTNITASQAGNASYNAAADVVQPLTVNHGNYERYFVKVNSIYGITNANQTILVKTLSTAEGENIESLAKVGTQIWGTANLGGVNSAGTLFRMDPDGTNFEVLHDFTVAEGSPRNDMAVVGDATVFGIAGDYGVFSISVASPGAGPSFYNGYTGTNKFTTGLAYRRDQLVTVDDNLTVVAVSTDFSGHESRANIQGSAAQASPVTDFVVEGYLLSANPSTTNGVATAYWPHTIFDFNDLQSWEWQVMNDGLPNFIPVSVEDINQTKMLYDGKLYYTAIKNLDNFGLQTLVVNEFQATTSATSVFRGSIPALNTDIDSNPISSLSKPYMNIYDVQDSVVWGLRGDAATGLFEAFSYNLKTTQYVVHDFGGGNLNPGVPNASFFSFRKVATLVTQDQTKVYGTANPTYTYDIWGLDAGDDAATIGGVATVARGVLGASKQASNVVNTSSHPGQYVIMATADTLNGKYDLRHNYGKLTITYDIQPSDITFSPATASYSYDGTTKSFMTVGKGGTPAGSSGIFADLSGSSLTATDFDYTYAASNDGGTTYAIDLGTTAPSDAGMYRVTAMVKASNAVYSGSATHDFTITPMAVTVTPDANQNKVYDGQGLSSDPALTYTFAPALLGADTFTGDLTRATGSNANTYAIEVGTLTAGNNYTLTLSAEVFEINPKGLTLTADNKTITYGDDQNSGHTVQYAGFIAGENENDLSGTLAFANISLGAGTHTGVIVPSGLTSSNYVISFVNGNLTINQKALTITADNKTISYGDDQNSGHTVQYVGFIAGENENDLNGALVFSNINLGSGTHIGVIVPSGLTSSNYAINFANGDLTIDKAVLTATADDKTKTYGEVNPTFTITYSGFVSGEDPSAITEPSISTNATVSSNSGTYPITLNGGSAQNYALTLVAGTLTVNKVDQTITFTDNLSSVDLGVAIINLTATGGASGETVTYSSSNTAVATVSGNTLTLLSGGTTTITASQAGNTNYNAATPVDQLLTVTAVFVWNGTSWNTGSAPTGTDDVRIDGNYTFSTNGVFEANNLEVSMGATLTVDDNPGNGSALVVNGDLNSLGLVHVVSGASLLTLGNVTGTGYQIDRLTTFDTNTGRYSIVGSPVQSSGFSVLGTNALVYGYDQSELYNASGNAGLDRFKTPVALGHSSMNVGEGYFSAFTGDANGLVSFTGTPNTGTVNVPLAFTDHAPVSETLYEGFNLVSNPYPSAIDFTAFMTANSSNIGGSIYLWDDNNSNSTRGDNADYVIVNSMGNTDSRSSGLAKWDGYIRSGQGFFVQNSTATNLTFDNSMRILSNNTDGGFYRTTPVSNSIKLFLSDGENQRAAIIGFADDASIGLDKAYDAINLSASALQLYSLQVEGNNKLGIQGLPQGYTEQVQLGFSTGAGGTYTISIANISELVDMEVVLLKDHLTGKTVNLKDEAYSFTTQASNDESRFTLQVAPSVISSIDKLADNAFYTYSTQGQLNVVFETVGFEKADFKLIDMTGKTVFEQSAEIRSNRWQMNTNSFPQSIYILMISTDNRVWKRRVITK